MDGAGPCWGCELCFKSSWELIHLSRDSTVWLSFERASALQCAEWMARGSGGGGGCVGVQWGGDSGSEQGDDSGEGGKPTDPRYILKIDTQDLVKAW